MQMATRATSDATTNAQQFLQNALTVMTSGQQPPQANGRRNSGISVFDGGTV